MLLLLLLLLLLLGFKWWHFPQRFVAQFIPEVKSVFSLAPTSSPPCGQ
jgi:hypothetical protein